MADKGVIFSASMVRALLAGRKTQTRRLIKPCPWPDDVEPPYIAPYPEGARAVWYDSTDCQIRLAAPHAVGDRLYVREACRALELEDGFDQVEYLADDEMIRVGDHPEHAVKWLKLFHYGQKKGASPTGLRGKGVPSIHMPRWASRMTMRVSEVRVQRLQDISEADAIAEGIYEVRSVAGDGMRHYGVGPADAVWPTAKRAYRNLWDALHTDPDESWDANPWVVAYSWPEVAQCNIDSEVA